ncbi:DciA family protein [Deferrisoma palaeochoriense]
MSREPSRPRPLGDTVRALLRTARSAAPGPAHRVWEVWDEVAGPELARRVRPLSLRGGVLVLGVPSSAWAQQITFLRQEILSRLNERLGGSEIRAIRVRTVGDEPAPPAAGRGSPRPLHPVSEEDRRRVEAVARELPDPELGAAFARLWLRHLSVRGPTEAPEAAPPPASTSGRERGEPGEA